LRISESIRIVEFSVLSKLSRNKLKAAVTKSKHHKEIITMCSVDDACQEKHIKKCLINAWRNYRSEISKNVISI